VYKCRSLAWLPGKCREACKQAVAAAIACGYSHIDTAAVYRNEDQVAAGILQSGIAREKLFITSKLATGDQGFDQALQAFAASCARLRTDYLDLYLIHWPGKGGLKSNSTQHAEFRKESWRALEQLYNEGKVRAIGVSNYTVRHLREMKEYCKMLPHVNQVEYHPYLFQKDLRDFCKAEGIQLEPYSSLGSGDQQLIAESAVVEAAKAHNRTPGQILLRWALQQDLVVIPKSTRAERIHENFDLLSFSLTDKEMQQLGSLNKNLHTCWDPTDLL